MAKVFANRIIKGKAIGANPTFADDANLVQEILENIEAIPPLKIDKKGIDWRLSIDGALGLQKVVESGTTTTGGNSFDVRYNSETHTLEKTLDGAAWSTVLEYVRYDA